MPNVLFISCIRFSMQLLISESVFTVGWKKKSWFPGRCMVGIAGYFLAAALIFRIITSIPMEHPIIVIVYYASLFVCTLILMRGCFETSWEESLFAGICGYATQHIAFATVTIFTELTGISLTGIQEFILIRFLPYVLVAILIYYLIVQKNTGKGELKKRDIRMILLAGAILFMVIVVSVLVDHRFFREQNNILQNVFCKIYGLVCSLLAIFIAFFVSRQNRILHEKEMMENMLHNMSEQKRLSQEAVNIINIKCHDLKYRISKITKIEDAEEQKEYIQGIKAAVAIYDNIFQTGNEALDLVLTEKSLLCNEYNIKLSAMADGKKVGFIHSTDLYALFGNLMDNAIESVMKEPDEEKRIISISVSERNGGSYIHMENYCNEEVVFEDGLPLTTKRDKDYHGFGVRSIRYLVDKYKGTFLMRIEKERFITDILFYPEDNKKY